LEIRCACIALRFNGERTLARERSCVVAIDVAPALDVTLSRHDGIIAPLMPSPLTEAAGTAESFALALNNRDPSPTVDKDGPAGVEAGGIPTHDAWHGGCSSRARMGRLLRCIVATTLTLALTGGLSGALAMTAAGNVPCPTAAHRCQEATFTCACCAEDGAPAPAAPSSERSSISKAPVSASIFALTNPAMTIAPPRALRAPVTHRTGPPLSLSILHASLLL